MDTTTSFMSVFDIFIACYALYFAIKGEGKVYEHEYPKEMDKAYHKFMRIFCWILGGGMLPLTILQYIYGFNSMWSVAMIAYVGICIVVFLIINYIKFRKPLKETKAKALTKKKH